MAPVKGGQQTTLPFAPKPAMNEANKEAEGGTASAKKGSIM